MVQDVDYTTEGNGHRETTPPELPTWNPEFNNPAVVIGDNIEMGNPGSRILNAERDLVSILKASVIEPEKAMHVAAAIAWVNRHNKKDKNGKGKNDWILESIKQALAADSAINGRLLKLYAETAIGVATTSTNWRDFQMPWSKTKEDKRDGFDRHDNPLSRQR